MSQETVQVLFASSNHNKIARIQALLADQPIKLLSLSDIKLDVPEPAETAPTCVEIAAQKALGYLQHIDSGLPVLTQDDTIRFIGVDEKDNPGGYIKEPVVNAYGKFTDEYAVKYYTEVARKYGGFIDIEYVYGHALGIKTTEARNKLQVYASQSSLPARLVSEVRGLEKVPGYPLSAITQVLVDNEWVHYTELSEDQKVSADHDLKASILGLLEMAKLRQYDAQPV